MTATRLWALDLIRIVAVVGVVAIHVFAGMVVNAEIRRSASWWAAVAIDIGFVWVVPAFVMISGALLFEPRQHVGGPAHFYRRRLLRLAPALIFWPFFYFLVIRTGVSGQPITRAAIASFVLDGRPYTHLYFLWLIVGLYAITPVLAAFLRDGGRRRALILAAGVLAATVITSSSSSLLGALGEPRPLTLMALTQWLPYVGYFVAGWALRDVVLRGWRLVGAIAGTLIALAVPILQYGTRPDLSMLDAVAPVSYFGLFVAAAAIGIFVCVKSLLAEWRPAETTTRLLRELSDSAFGVFLIHFALMVIIRRIAPFDRADGSISLSLLEWLFVVVLSFLMVMGMRRAPLVRRLV